MMAVWFGVDTSPYDIVSLKTGVIISTAVRTSDFPTSFVFLLKFLGGSHVYVFCHDQTHTHTHTHTHVLKYDSIRQTQLN